MTNGIRRVISEKFKQIANIRNVYHELEVPTKKQQFAAGGGILQWIIPEHISKQAELIKTLSTIEFNKEHVKRVQLMPGVGKNAAKLEFQLEDDAFAELVLKPTPDTANLNNDHIVVEFSSPNIAKPFHVGHLRSTIIGNVVANLHKHLGHHVTKMNYLGDWGTQFGLLQLGVKLCKITDSDMRDKPIETLYRAYVTANKAAEKDPSLTAQARTLFSAMESGADASMTKQWQQYRAYTTEELSHVYARLGVHFDYYDWESQYSQREIANVLQRLRENGLLLLENDGREIVQVDERRVPVIKSDGSTLYLARDIAALLERFVRFKFARILYVVENGQSDHFNACFKTASALNTNLTMEKLKHVKFGRIHGMSTRKGNAIFLSDVLDEAHDIMRDKRKNSATTKTNSNFDDEHVCDILGVSAVIINDLKQRRQRDYDFNWQQALQMNGDTGIKLQYTHCRLHSLLAHFDDIDVAAISASWRELAEPEAQDLIYEIARFEQSVWNSKQQLEACILVNYLFSLCNSTSRALKRLQVKNESCPEKQKQRILLFHAAKRTLKTGMELLGLRPLNQM